MKAKAPPPTPRSLLLAARELGLRRSLRVPEFKSVTLRPIAPKDEPLMVQFHRTLTEETIHQRYFEQISLEARVRHERLLRICTNDDDSFALAVATPSAILGVGRLSRITVLGQADFALLVSDKAQSHGIGTALMKGLIALAGAAGFGQMVGEILVANHEMLHLCRHFGFVLHTVAEDGLVNVALDLPTAA